MITPPPLPTIIDMIDLNARNRPDGPAFVSDDVIITWRQVRERVITQARSLVRRGVDRGQVVAMLLDASADSWIAILAVLRAGGVAAPVSTMSTQSMVAGLVEDSGATLLLASDGYRRLAAAGLASLPAGTEVALLGPDDLTAAGPDDGAGPSLPLPVPEDRCNIIYSSGTTGRPKGIVHTHAARHHFAASLASAFHVASSARGLLLTPPHTNGSWAVVLPILYVGGTVILSDGFTVDGFAASVTRHRPTLAFVVPTIAARLVGASEAQRLDYSCFDAIVSAGASMSPDLKRRFRELTGERLGELWGLTEGAGACIQPAEMPEHSDSTGRAVPGCELRIIDGEGREVPAGGEGEIVGRSGFMLREYHGRQDATDAVIWHDADGRDFIRTGDLGVLDQEGWLSIRGRLKEMIISGGLNVFPSDIEDVLEQHPGVAECAVVPVADVEWGERPAACVVLHADAATSGDDIRDWLNQRVAKHQRVVEVIALPSLPRNALGKVLRGDLLASISSRVG